MTNMRAMKTGFGICALLGACAWWGCGSESSGDGAAGGDSGADDGTAQDGNDSAGDGSAGGDTSADADGSAGDASGSDASADGSIGNDGEPAPPTTEAPGVFGDTHAGQYHLGPVDFAQTAWPNACAPAGGYRQELRAVSGLGGEYLAGIDNSFGATGDLCDACIEIKTATGRSIVARIVTYGVEMEPGDIDVSPSVFEALSTDEYPRSMTWQLAKCPDAGTIRYEYQAEANPWWTSLWVRNARVPLERVEVKGVNDADFVPLQRAADGTLTDPDGFGEGPFTLRLTGIDGQVIEEPFDGFEAGALVVSSKQFE